VCQLIRDARPKPNHYTLTIRLLEYRVGNIVVLRYLLVRFQKEESDSDPEECFYPRHSNSPVFIIGWRHRQPIFRIFFSSTQSRTWCGLWQSYHSQSQISRSAMSGLSFGPTEVLTLLFQLSKDAIGSLFDFEVCVLFLDRMKV
jgi:hypothetical protein